MPSWVSSFYNPSFCSVFFTIKVRLCFIFYPILLLFFTFFPFLRNMQYISPRLFSSCSSGSELYALSKHRCCSLLLVSSLDLCDDDGRLLITVLSTTSLLPSWYHECLQRIWQPIVVFLFYLLKYVFLCLVCFYQWHYFQSSPPS